MVQLRRDKAPWAPKPRRWSIVVWTNTVALIGSCYALFIVYMHRRMREAKLDEQRYGLLSMVENPANGSALSGTTNPPSWARDYFAWHAEQRKVMTAASNHRYLVHICLQTDRSCGGLSDRVKSLPYFLLLAAKSKRVYLIYWDRPCRLEEFLEPPPDGLDWRVPTWLLPTLNNRQTPLATTHESILHYVHDASSPVITARLQDQHGGSDYYNKQQSLSEGPRAFRRVYRTLFHRCFVPTPPLARAVESAMAQLGLVPGRFTAAHFRAKYNELHPLTKSIVQALAVNAVNCASELRRDSQEHIFFATDSRAAMASVQLYRDTMQRPIVMFPNRPEPLHLDRASSRNPSDYFDVFVDLFVLSSAHCIAHAQGGYGRLAVLLSHNASCFTTMITGGRVVECSWKE